jgi:microcystin-dependent protein
MQGNVPICPGQSPGFSLYDLGQESGTPNVTLLQTEMPIHAHTMQADTADPADTNVPSPNASLAITTGGTLYQTTQNAQLSPQALTVAGSSLPHNNMMPYVTLNFCIALQGIFPARN